MQLPRTPNLSAAPQRKLRILAWPAFKNRSHQPYTSLLYERFAALGATVDEFVPSRLLTRRYDVLHVHWPESPLMNNGAVMASVKVSVLAALLVAARARHTKIVWTVHNLQSHEHRHPGLERRLRHFLADRLDGVIALSPTGLAQAIERFPQLERVAAAIVPLGHYRDEYPTCMSRAEARAVHGLDAGERSLLFIGSIREYKNVPLLVRVFRQLDDPALRLTLVGRVQSTELEQAIRAEAHGDPRIRLRLEHVQNAEVQTYLRSADLVVLPYREVLNSASALLALSFDVPVLAPDRGALGDLQAAVGSAWMRLYSDAFEPSVLRDGLAWALATDRSTSAPLDGFAWDHIARTTVAFLERLAGHHHRS